MLSIILINGFRENVSLDKVRYENCVVFDPDLGVIKF